MQDHASSPEDRRFRDDFEACRLDVAHFDHRAHVRLAYVYLVEQDHDVEAATARMRSGLHAFLHHHRIDPAKYHETLTCAWILAVRHFLERSPACCSADAFVAANPALLDSRIMRTHYSAELLTSSGARERFESPDLEPIPRHER